MILIPEKEERSIVCIGLDRAGKTTILYTLKLNEVITCGHDHCGFTVETFSYKNEKFTFWVLGGSDYFRHLWNKIVPKMDSLIWVVNAEEPERLQESKEALWNYLDSISEIDHVDFILVLINKSDRATLRCLDVALGLDLFSLSTNSTGKRFNWHVQSCVGFRKESIEKGMEIMYKYFNVK